MRQILYSIVGTTFQAVKRRPMTESAAFSQDKVNIILDTNIQNIFIVLAIIIIALYVVKKKRHLLYQVIVILTIIDLFTFSKGNLITFPISITSLESSASKWLKQNLGNYRFVSTSGNFPYTGLGVYWTHLRAREPFSPNNLTGEELKQFTRLKKELTVIPENQGLRSNIADASGYAAAIPSNYLHFWNEEPKSPNTTSIQDLNSNKLNLAGVKYVITGYPDDYLASLDSVQFERVFGEDHVQIYENQDVIPRVFLLDNNQDQYPAQIIDYSPNRVLIETELDRISELVLTDTFYPGWTAYVDGEPSSVESYEGAFRKVALPFGKHIVEFRYEPDSLRLGAIISASTVVLLFSSLIWQKQKSQLSSSISKANKTRSNAFSR